MDLQRTLLTEIILNMSSGGSFICDFFKKGESCLRNYKNASAFFFCYDNSLCYLRFSSMIAGSFCHLPFFGTFKALPSRCLNS